jgi:hypothetical protein
MGKILKEMGVAAGTGTASFVFNAALTFGAVAYRYPIERSPIISSLAIGALALAAKYATLGQEKTLEKRDYIVIGSSALVGGCAGHTAAYAVISAYLAAQMGAIAGSLIITGVANMCMLPLNMVLVAGGRKPQFMPFPQVPLDPLSQFRVR